ncbi:hypothetical protein [Comamonas sp. 26]|uniref:hypothetical protein n=1 Tax=Comamonas sp. 26 TaxID=2035201 RepID=UPI000C19486C|nr:hypothetical protein [Comamonas sp. 26]PIG07848.1 hypothetical protein CLU84_0675 [Comamonas sp. 26]
MSLFTAIVLSAKPVTLVLPGVQVLGCTQVLRSAADLHSARLDALAKVQTPYCFYLDDDDELPDDYLSVLAECEAKMRARGVPMAYTEEILREPGKSDVRRSWYEYDNDRHAVGPMALHHLVVMETVPAQEVARGLPLVPPGMELRCYMTGPNGSMFHRAEMAEFGGAALITTQADTGALAETMGLMPLPAGQILRAHKSRMLCARGHVLFYSQAFAPLLADPVAGYVAFDAPITMVRPCGQGVYVAAGRTYWFAGDLSIADMQEVLPYDALPGSDSCHPKNPETVFWMSEHGLVRANSAGQLMNVQEENLAIEGGQRAATYLRERGGQRHVIAATQSPGIARGAVHASMDAEIVRY